jgi:hypothetical protein
MPYAAPGPAVRHEPVRPRAHRSQPAAPDLERNDGQLSGLETSYCCARLDHLGYELVAEWEGPGKRGATVDDDVIEVASGDDYGTDERVFRGLESRVSCLLPPHSARLHERKLSHGALSFARIT